jgi:hypothetical protein
LVLATFVPFAILRLIPAIEAGAIGHLEGLRQRGSAAVTGPLRTAAGFALHSGLQSAGDARLMGMTAAGGALGGGDVGGVGSGSGDAPKSTEDLLAEVTPENGGLIKGPDGRAVGDPSSPRMYDELMASGGVEPRPKGPKPIVGWSESSDGGGATGDDDAPGAAPTADAWKWQGVPPGRRFLYPVEPGKHRFYIDYDEQGPKMVGLPPAWPADHAEGDG